MYKDKADVKIILPPYQDKPSQTVALSLPIDVPLERLMPAIATKLNLPSATNENRQIQYSVILESTGEIIGDQTKLENLTLKENDSLRIITSVSDIGSRERKLPIPEKELLDAVGNTAPIYIPARENLAIGLVPIDLVYRLEEHRSDEIKWQNILWVFIGSVLGMVINWVTAESFTVNKYSLIIGSVFVIMIIFSGSSAFTYHRRAEDVRKKLNSFSERR
ncbi:MAG: hypothetical protein H6634_13745 [Anaerolineales bacterium]|nr:hypothetical protein [Anaerolineales bacterium]